MKINNYYLLNIAICAAIIIPCLSERYYLLNFKPPNNSTTASTTVLPSSKPSPFKVNCIKTAGCLIQNGGWRHEANEWRFDETSLNRLCCRLDVELALPSHLPRPKEIYVNLVINFHQCRVFGSRNKCRENLMLRGDIKEDIYPLKTEVNVDKRLTRSFIPDIKKQTIGIKFSSIRFNGAIKKIQVYFEHCPSVGTVSLVEYPNMAINSSVDGKCISNAVVVSALKPVRTCDLKGLAGNVGYCSCNKGFMLSQNVTCIACAPGFFKPSVGIGGCQKCPKGSQSSLNRTRCICEQGFQRINASDESLECFKPGLCSRTTINAGSLGSYHFPKTKTNEQVTRTCQYGSINQMQILQRKCVMTSSGNTKWSDLDLSNCRHASCSAENILNKEYGIYKFPATEVGQSVRYTCFYGNKNNTYHLERKCQLINQSLVANGMPNIMVSRWAKLDLTKCRNYTEIFDNINKSQITNESVKNILEAFQSRNHNRTIQSADVIKTVNFLQKCLLVADTEEVFDIVLSFINNMATNITITSTQSSSAMLTTLDLLAGALIKSSSSINTTITYSGTNMAFSLKTIPQNHTGDVTAVITSGDVMNVNFTSDDIWIDSNYDYFQLPRELFRTSHQHVYSYVFKDSSMFVSNCSQRHGNTKNNTVDGNVVSITLYNNSVLGLSNPINITTRISDSASRQRKKATCGFWKVEENPAQSHWSSEGCTASKQYAVNGSHFITCQCDHLTSFGVLLNIYEDSFKMASSFELSLVSQIGCYISIGSLLITIVSLSFLRELRRKTANKILVNLSFSILGLLVCFLLGVEFVETNGICTSVGVLLHVFVLSTFMWMTVEAISLYRKAVRTFKNRGEGKMFFRTCFCLAWGGPILVAISSRFSGYFKLADNRLHCMISGVIFKYALLVPVSLLLAINLVLFIPIIRKVQGHITTRSSFKKIPKKARLRRRARVTISCSALLGLTWALAYLSIGNASIVFQWAFAVINSMQGFFILLFHVFLNDGVIKAWRSYLTSVKSKNSEGSTNSTSTNRKDTSPIWLRTIKKGSTSSSSQHTQHPLLRSESSSLNKIDLVSRYHIPK